jgi:hypothetical protein
VTLRNGTSLIGDSALLTAACIVGGIAGAVALGSAVDAVVRRYSSDVVAASVAAPFALAVIILAARQWGRRMSAAAGIGDPARTGKSTMLFVALPFILVGSLLSPLEPPAVRFAGEHSLPIHAAYIALFVPATLIVAGIGSFGLGRGMRDNTLGSRFAAVAAPAAALAFLLVAGFMYLIGWRVGSPDAARRATMLVVTTVSTIGAALAGGAGIGWSIRRMTGGR